MRRLRISTFVQIVNMNNPKHLFPYLVLKLKLNSNSSITINVTLAVYLMILTRALRNDSLSFLGAYDAASFLPFVPGGLGGDTLPFPASHVLLRMCLGFLRYPVNIKYKTTVEKQRSLNRQKCECVT